MKRKAITILMLLSATPALAAPASPAPASAKAFVEGLPQAVIASLKNASAADPAPVTCRRTIQAIIRPRAVRTAQQRPADFEPHRRCRGDPLGDPVFVPGRRRVGLSRDRAGGDGHDSDRESRAELQREIHDRTLTLKLVKLLPGLADRGCRRHRHAELAGDAAAGVAREEVGPAISACRSARSPYAAHRHRGGSRRGTRYGRGAERPRSLETSPLTRITSADLPTAIDPVSRSIPVMRAGTIVAVCSASRVGQPGLLVEFELAHQFEPVAVGAGHDAHPGLVQPTDHLDHLGEALAEIFAGQTIEQRIAADLPAAHHRRGRDLVIWCIFGAEIALPSEVSSGSHTVSVGSMMVLRLASSA